MQIWSNLNESRIDQIISKFITRVSKSTKNTIFSYLRHYSSAKTESAEVVHKTTENEKNPNTFADL